MTKVRNRKLRAALALALVAASTAWAHDPGLSVATARVSGGSLAVHLALARSDAERLAAFDANPNGQVTKAESPATLSQLQQKAQRAFAVSCGCRRLEPAKATVTRDDREGVHFEITFPGVTAGDLNIRSAMLDALPRGHRQFLSVRDETNHLLAEQMLEQNLPSLTVPVTSPAQPVLVSRPQSFRQFLALGINHIATGYDHLLFLLGLLLVGGAVRSALKIITSFTVAHSITLALATLNIIHISPKLIEPLIAASIVFVGLQNLLGSGVENRWMLTFGFGLIHGCGFASALRDLGIGANGTSIAAPLLSFNLGVELGQLAIAAFVLPVIWKCRASPVFVRRLVPAGSALIVMAGAFWLLQRTLL
ncbi:MAG TPA: HupE/UreJ family protein [Candidatus Acidoferrum sp.]|nr:HupE/UreJ family protein [Candidatus Acidoferrum sp.]